MRTPSPNGVIGTTGTYEAMIQTATTPLTANYTTESGSGLQAYGDLSCTQDSALAWLKADTALAYSALIRAAGSHNTAPVCGGLLEVMQIGAEFATTAGTAGDLFVTGGQTAVANQVMTGATLMTFATCNTIAVSGDNNDVFSFGSSDRIAVSGTGNTLYGGPGSNSFQLSGHLNTFRGGEGCATVTLTGPDAAANIVIGDVGTLNVVSTAPVTQFIGGPGSTCMNLTGDYSSILLGNGNFSGTIVSNGVAIETGAGRATISVAAQGGVIVTGSGSASVCASGTGIIMLQGDAGGSASFSFTGIGATVCGGDYVCVSGSGNEVRSRTEGLSGGLGARFGNVLGNMRSFATDPVIASAVAATNPYFNLDGTVTAAGAAAASCCQPSYCCSTSPSARFISVSGSQNAVYADTRFDQITVNGDNNNFYGSASGRSVNILSGSHNLIWGSAGCNTYVGDGQANVLEYIALPGAATSPGPVVVNLAIGLALNSYGGLDHICGINWVEAGSGSTLIGGAAPATLTILGDHGTLRDGAGNDTLYASGSGNLLQSSHGNDLLHTGGQDNIYQLGSCSGVPCQTEIRQDWMGVTGTLQFMTPVAPSQLWFNQDTANNLVIHVLGSREVVTVDNWFGGQAGQLATITTPGFTISNADVNTLQAAMATYQAGHAGFDPASASRAPTDSTLGSAYAAAWHAQ